jgi:hypothetical protein
VVTAEDFRARLNYGAGSAAEHWIGCPLLDQQHLPLGAIVIQSYTPEHTCSDEDQALFGVIANHAPVALQSLQSVDRLERAVHERTILLEAQNAALNTALTQLQQAQVELVRQEKLASLGSLVAGVAHEINTPKCWRNDSGVPFLAAFAEETATVGAAEVGLGEGNIAAGADGFRVGQPVLFQYILFFPFQEIEAVLACLVDQRPQLGRGQRTDSGGRMDADPEQHLVLDDVAHA